MRVSSSILRYERGSTPTRSGLFASIAAMASLSAFPTFSCSGRLTSRSKRASTGM